MPKFMLEVICLYINVFIKLSYCTKLVALVLLILQSYYHNFIELKNTDRNLVQLTWICKISLFLFGDKDFKPVKSLQITKPYKYE